MRGGGIKAPVPLFPGASRMMRLRTLAAHVAPTASTSPTPIREELRDLPLALRTPPSGASVADLTAQFAEDGFLYATPARFHRKLCEITPVFRELNPTLLLRRSAGTSLHASHRPRQRTCESDRTRCGSSGAVRTLSITLSVLISNTLSISL